MERKLKIAPLREPITLADVKEYLKVNVDALDNETDDNIVSLLIKAAREYVEAETSRVLITQTWNLYLDKFPTDKNYIEIPFGTLQSISSIKYTDSDGNENTWSDSKYIVDTISYVPRVVLAYGESFPSTTYYPSNPINIEVVCGYGDTPDSVPNDLKLAVALLTSHWYENRQLIRSEDNENSITVDKIPYMVDLLLAKYKFFKV